MFQQKNVEEIWTGIFYTEGKTQIVRKEERCSSSLVIKKYAK